jgi:SAM-dependent methyltransferase
MFKDKKNFYLLSKYYDFIHKNKNYLKEVNHIDRLLKKYSNNKKNILEFGSGTGSHANFFVKKNYTVHGIEKSKDMIKNCKKVKGFTFQLGDIGKTKLKKKFDIVLSLFHVLSYQSSNTSLNNFFKNANYHLKPKGFFGVDFWYTAAVNFQKPEVRLQEASTNNFKFLKLARPLIYKSKKIIKVKYLIAIKSFKNKKINIIEETHTMRHFSLSELKNFFNKYKFKLIHAVELISNKKPSKNTWGVFCLLQKN